MGCGVNSGDTKCCGCSRDLPKNANQPVPTRKRLGAIPDASDDTNNCREDTVVDGVCLREANIGHYFTETELFGCGASRSAMKQLEYRLDKWKLMCTYQAPKTPSRIICFF